MATKRKPYHPPLLTPYTPPETDTPGYIPGHNGDTINPQGFGSKNFSIAQIPPATARSIIIAHHYSKRVVNNSYLHLGLYREGAFEGVLQFGYALNPARAGKIVQGTVQGEYLELNRMWLSDEAPRNSESRAISYAIKYIRKACPTTAWIQSFADEKCGGLGVVYQAANFLYVGSHKTTFYALEGDTYHKMLLTTGKKEGIRGKYLRENLHRAKKQTLRQFRYIFFLKRNWVKRLNLKIHTYPKP